MLIKAKWLWISLITMLYFPRNVFVPAFCPPCERYYFYIPLLFSHRTYSYWAVCRGIYIENPCCVMKGGKYTVDVGIFFSSPGQKGEVRYCNHLASIIVCKLFILQTCSHKSLHQMEPNLRNMLPVWSSTIYMIFVPFKNWTWLLGPILIFFLLINHLWDRIFCYMV